MMDSPTETVLDSESLFSLEVVVEKLFLHKKVGCRFPAVAFRLLDFPTLLIYHVEPALADSIKRKIAADPFYKLPPQMHELHDKDGCFPVKKGKSSLFRVSANTLLNHLGNTPLYVMIIDTYPETPKLLGNSTIGLDAAMESVYGDICKLGISVPSVHGEKGVYTVYNLMGAEIGKIALGFRLLSLGVGLLSHIPDRALVKLKKKEPKSGSNQKAPAEDDFILEDLETIDKTVQVALSSAEPQIHGETQTDMQGMLHDVSVQTHKKPIKKPTAARTGLHIQTQPPDEPDDFFVTNVSCPPPLYYNSEAEVQQIVQRVRHKAEMVDADSESDESQSTIRYEDKFSDSDVEDFREEEPAPAPTKLQKPRPPGRSQTELLSSWLNNSPAKSKRQQSRDFSNFPVLNALLQEIATLPGVQVSGLSHPAVPAKHAIRDRSPKSPRAKTAAQRRPVQEQLVDGDVTSRLSSPRRIPRTEAAPKQGVLSDATASAAAATTETKQKGWFRKEPPVGVKKTKLTYGMTNTQRLRLAKGNPELLKTLEKTEQERLQKRRAEQLTKYPWLRKEGSFMKLNTADISTEISKHAAEENASMVPKLDLGQLDGDPRPSGQHRPSRKPVPTPRKSLSLTEKDRPFLTPRQTAKAHLSVVESGSQSEARTADDQEASAPHSSRSHKSIEVHVPSASAHDDSADSEATSVYGSELDDQDIMGRTRTVYTPGFPKESLDTTGYSGGRSSALRHYSDDFEDDNLTSTMGEEPALRRIVDKYSDDDTPPADGVVLSVEDLGLRRVVETYSDYSEPEPSQHSESRSFKSALSDVSDHSSAKNGTTSNTRLRPGLPNPPSSTHSPVTAESMHIKQPSSGMATREPIAGSSSTDNPPPVGSHDTNAYMSRSALSMDSSEGRSTPRRPKASPRKSRDFVPSLHTESISSYAPSEGDNLTPLSPGAEYSDSFEDDEDNGVFPEPGHVDDIKLAPEAKMHLGYTWT